MEKKNECEVDGCNKEVDGIIQIGNLALKVCSPEHMELRLKQLKKGGGNSSQS